VAERNSCQRHYTYTSCWGIIKDWKQAQLSCLLSSTIPSFPTVYLGSCSNNELLPFDVCSLPLPSIVSLEMNACAIINEQCLQSVSPD
jgi:hypothetical protein